MGSKMGATIDQMLSDVRVKIPKLFKIVLDNCKKLVESFETKVRITEQKLQNDIDALTSKPGLTEDLSKRFKLDQMKAINNFKEETQIKLRTISEKVLKRIQDLNRQCQEVVRTVIELQRGIKNDLSKYIEDHSCDPKNIMKFCHEKVDPLYQNFIKVKKSVDKILRTLPKRMDIIYSDLEGEIKRLEEQTFKNCESLVDKYKRLTDPMRA